MKQSQVLHTKKDELISILFRHRKKCLDKRIQAFISKYEVIEQQLYANS